MRKKSFAEILAEAKAEPSIRSGTPATWGGPLRDQAGHVLAPMGYLRPAAARQLVLDGALLAWDGCGCGDYPPAWIEPADALVIAKRSKPTLEVGNACETYLDHWSDACGDVVCMHGDVDWGIDYPKA